jgi:pyridoxamine 5'-phosphate oxidase
MIDNETLAAIRSEYSSHTLDESQVDTDPLTQFRLWFQEALGAQVKEVNAMCLSTINAMGRPESRIVLLKSVDDRGFSFFTNYKSAKGRQLELNPFAALNFFWPELERQVCIEGKVEKLPGIESDKYFNSRPRGSQIGAWVSEQSEVIENREWLENRLAELEKKFGTDEVPRPEHWGGYVLEPDAVEFWQGRPGRLHDRIQYLRVAPGESWMIRRVSP